MRIGFSLPESEARLLDHLKKAPRDGAGRFRKSQLMRAGLLLLRDFEPQQLQAMAARLPRADSTRKQKK